MQKCCAGVFAAVVSTVLSIVLGSSAAAQTRVETPLVRVAGAGPLAGAAALPPGLAIVATDATSLHAVMNLHKGVPAIVKSFPLGPGRDADLRVERFDVLSPDAQVVLGTAEGDVAVRWPEVALLRGTVTGAERSRVYLGLSAHGCNGFIEADGETFILAGKPGEPTVVYSTSQLPPEMLRLGDQVCGGAIVGDAPEGEGGGEPLELPQGPTPPPCRTVRVAVDGDFEYYRDVFGSNATTAQAYIVTLMGGVSEIYRTNLSVTLQVSFSRVWTTASDPYPNGSVSSSLLSSMRTYWNSNMGGTPRNVAHLLTSSSRSGGAGGIAYLQSVCQGGNSYGISGFINGSFPNPLILRNGGNWDLVVVAHEIGHNFAAVHTHEMSNPPDLCGAGDCSLASQGTIMSYCHTCSGGIGNIALQFHLRNINEQMLPYLAGGASTCVQPGSCQAQVVNMNSRTACSGANGAAQLVLSAGTYAFLPVDTSTGGAYTAWSPWGSNTGCSGTTGCCTQGWVWRYEYNTGAAWSPVGLAGCNRSTEAAAFANQSEPEQVTLAAQAITQFRLSDAGCTDNRGGVSLKVVRCPTIQFHPANRTNCASVSSVTFAVSAAGEDLAYQWFRNGAAVVNDAHITGATSPTLVISRPTGFDAGDYRCVVSNACGAVESNIATLAQSNFGPIILEAPEPVALDAGQDATFDVRATGVGTLTYRWRRNGVNLTEGGKFTGVQTPMLRVAGATSAEAGAYDCVTTDLCGQRTTGAASLTINTGPCPADFNGDGALDPDDLGDYLNCYFAVPPCPQADWTGDGNIDPDDLGDYLNLFFGAGC